jgi:hypothetical protein
MTGRGESQASGSSLVWAVSKMRQESRIVCA